MLGLMFRVSIFGESHGRGIGSLIEGCPPGVPVSEELLREKLRLRHPNTDLFTSRREEDEPEILSGVFNGRSTGAPIAIFIRNRDLDSSSYEIFRHVPRPSHADYVASVKYMGFNDYRGGGIFSGRITAGIVAAGAVAGSLLSKFGISVMAHVIRIGRAVVERELSPDEVRRAYESPVRCADSNVSMKMVEEIRRAREEGDSIGGEAEVMATGVPVGLGDPPIDTLDGDIAKAIFMIPGVKGVEFGAGFRLSSMRGSEANDPFVLRDGRVETEGNKSGGINGGISNGMPIRIRVAFRPTPSISIPQRSVDLREMKPVILRAMGRFDACIVPRAIPALEAVVSIVLADHLLRWASWMWISRG
ncbi:MAG: chorismate synthase [Candidatus Methanodesulfokora sp.]